MSKGLVILSIPWHSHSQELRVQIATQAGYILFYDGSVVKKLGNRWHISCLAADKEGDAGEFIRDKGWRGPQLISQQITFIPMDQR